MKVFHFILDHRVGGPHVYVRSIISMLAPELSSKVVTTGRGEATDVALTNFRHRFKLLYPIEVVWNVVRLCWRFRASKSRRNVIFDVHGAANIAPIFAARLMGIPVVWHFHETLSGFINLVRLGKAVMSHTVHRHVVVAGKSAEVFGIADAVLIPGAVDAEFWRPTRDDVVRERGDDVLRLIAVGNINPLKGVDILLEALKGVNVPWKLVVVGAELQTFDAYAAGLHEQTAGLARFDRCVEFVGWQSSESVRDLLAWADVFVLPSRSEACPIALLEAMAMECACIASDVGDIREILSESGSGIVVKSESPMQLMAALTEIAALGPEGRRRMGRRARESVIMKYSQQMMAQRHLEIYKKLAREAEELN